MEVEVRDEIVRKVTVPDSGYFSSPGGIFFDVNEDRVVMVKTTNIPSLKLMPGITMEEHSVLAIYMPLKEVSLASFKLAFQKVLKNYHDGLIKMGLQGITGIETDDWIVRDH